MIKHWPWFIFFGLAAFLSFGIRPLGDPDEGRYAETAREMLTSGDWLVPHLQGQPHMTKPPLTYWAGAASMRVLGINEWGARLPVAIAFFLTILCVIELARTWGMGTTACVAAGLVFCTAMLPFTSGHLLTTDMILTFWETLGVLALWKVWRGSGLAFFWRWIFWLAFALAFLTKGPPGWLPLLGVAVFCLAARMHRPQKRIFSLPAFLVFVAVSLSWYLAIIRWNPELLRYFIRDEVIGRVLSNEHHRAKPFWFYPAVIVTGLTPWIFLWPALVRRTLIDIKPELAGRGAFPSFAKLRATIARHWQLTHEQRELHFFAFLWGMIAHSATFIGFKIYHFWHRLRRIEDIKFFSFLWFFVPLAVFALATSKMILYVVPLFIPLAIWSGHVLAGWRPGLLPPSPRMRRWFWLGAAAWGTVVLVFINLPDRPSLSSSHRALAREAREVAVKTGAHQFYSVEEPQHSISFYSGLLIHHLDQDTEDVLKYLREHHPASEGPALLTLKTKWLKKLEDTGYTVLADNGRMALVQVGPHPAKPPVKN